MAGVFRGAEPGSSRTLDRRACNMHAPLNIPCLSPAIFHRDIRVTVIRIQGGGRVERVRLLRIIHGTGGRNLKFSTQVGNRGWRSSRARPRVILITSFRRGQEWRQWLDSLTSWAKGGWCVENERRRFFFLFNDFLENERNGMDGMEGGVVFAIFE